MIRRKGGIIMRTFLRILAYSTIYICVDADFFSWKTLVVATSLIVVTVSSMLEGASKV